MRAARPPLTPRAALRWAAVAPVVRRLKPDTILEIGCGQGAMGVRLAELACYLGVEPDAHSYSRARRRILGAGGQVLHRSDEELRADRQYDLVCAFEVLEHLPDDVSAVRRWLARVKPGGHLLLSVPAGPARFGASDILVGHYRRYDTGSLRSVFAAAHADACTTWHYGWPLGSLLDRGRDVLARRRLARAGTDPTGHSVGTPGSGRLLQPTTVAGPVIRLAVAPFALAQRWAPHRGTGLIALAPVPRHDARPVQPPLPTPDPPR